MQLKGNVLILGDSFCQSVGENSWPAHLLKKIEHNESIVKGWSGGSWWAIRENLLKIQKNESFFKNVDLLIFIHTNKNRLLTRNDNIFKIKPQILPAKFSNSDIDEKILTVALYFKYIHDLSFVDWAQQQWFLEFSQISKHIPCVINLFFNPPDASIALPGIKVNTGLINLALNQYNRNDPNLRDLIVNEGYINHLTPENNKQFADQLYNIIVGNAIDFDLTKFNRE